jgi:hypothetical protein
MRALFLISMFLVSGVAMAEDPVMDCTASTYSYMRTGLDYANVYTLQFARIGGFSVSSQSTPIEFAPHQDVLSSVRGNEKDKAVLTSKLWELRAAGKPNYMRWDEGMRFSTDAPNADCHFDGKIRKAMYCNLPPLTFRDADGKDRVLVREFSFNCVPAVD